MDKIMEYADMVWGWLNWKMPIWGVIILVLIAWFS
jgi:hypothetical protein